jgi:hypothetical protein
MTDKGAQFVLIGSVKLSAGGGGPFFNTYFSIYASTVALILKF